MVEIVDRPPRHLHIPDRVDVRADDPRHLAQADREADGEDMAMSGYQSRVRGMGFTAGGQWLVTGGAPGLVLWPFNGANGPMGRQALQLDISLPGVTGRLAVDGAGRIVAMEPTRQLLGRLSGVQMALKLRGALPAALMPQLVEQSGDRYVLKVGQPADVEAVLAACRNAACEIDDIEVGHADLEEVFLQVMSDPGQKRAA